MKQITLTQGKIALVDDSGFDMLSKFKWFANKFNGKWYAVRSFGTRKTKKGSIMMHREIMKTVKGMDTDHIDGDGLNNQRKNLRACTHSENSCNRGKQKNNTSGFKGVTWNKTGKTWQAQIKVKNKYIYLGCSPSESFAYKMYVEGCEKYHGKFSNSN